MAHFASLTLVDRQADDPTIKKAYKKLAKKYHPDKNKDEGAQARFADVSHGKRPNSNRLLRFAEPPRLTLCLTCSLRGSDGRGGTSTELWL